MSPAFGPDMTDKEWEAFFETLKKVVNDGRPHKEKTAELMSRANEFGAQTELLEMVDWLHPDQKHE